MNLNRQNIPALRHLDTSGDIDLCHFPDLMVIGPQRTATTWLFENLRRHPQLHFARDKEIYFFNLLNQTNHRRFRSSKLAWYLEFFADPLPRSNTLRAEATSSYAAMAPELIRNITLLNPGLKAILLVRDPVERAWSQFKCMHRDNRVESATAADFDRYYRDGYERRCNHFSAIIDAWEYCLKPGNLFVGAFHRVASEPQCLIDEISDFLGIERGLPNPGLLWDRVGDSAKIDAPSHFINAIAKQFENERQLLRERCLIPCF